MRSALLGAAVLLLAGSFVQGAIIGHTCQDDGDGVFVLGPDHPLTYNATTDEYTLDISGKHMQFAPGHLSGDFFTDTPEDPVVWIMQQVENYTNFDWTGYHIDLGMDKPFSIIGVVAPMGWNYSIIQPVPNQPLPGHPSPGLGHVGQVDFFGGPPILANQDPAQSGTFGVVVAFEGTVAFCTEQYPVPEPTTALLLGIGGLLLRRRIRS